MRGCMFDSEMHLWMLEGESGEVSVVSRLLIVVVGMYVIGIVCCFPHNLCESGEVRSCTGGELHTNLPVRPELSGCWLCNFRLVCGGGNVKGGGELSPRDQNVRKYSS